MKLDYFSLISPEPIKIYHIGSIISPTLREVSKITYPVYLSYVNVLLMDLKTYYEMLDKSPEQYFLGMTEDEKNSILNVKLEYDSLNEEEKSKITFFDVMRFDKRMIESLLNALNFFVEDTVEYSVDNNVFATYSGAVDKENNQIITGYIHRDNYYDFVDLILQRINVSKEITVENTKVKNKTAEKILAKLQKGAKAKKQKSDKKMELGNIISSLSSHHNSINIVNVWDLTVYQLYDQFTRQRYDDSYNITSMSVAAWGDKDKKFDDTMWFATINEN